MSNVLTFAAGRGCSCEDLPPFALSDPFTQCGEEALEIPGQMEARTGSFSWRGASGLLGKPGFARCLLGIRRKGPGSEAQRGSLCACGGPTLSPACRASLPLFPLSFRPPEELTKALELSDGDTHYFLTSMSMRKFRGSFFCLYWEEKGHTLFFSLPWLLMPSPPVDSSSFPGKINPSNSAVLGYLRRDWLSSPQLWRLCSFCKSFFN